MFEKLDRFPIVKALQVMAAVFCIVGLISVVNQVIWPYFVNGNPWNSAEILLSGVQLFLMNLHAILYKPLVLLALAEIIKLMRKKNDQN